MFSLVIKTVKAISKRAEVYDTTVCAGNPIPNGEDFGVVGIGLQVLSCAALVYDREHRMHHADGHSNRPL